MHKISLASGRVLTSSVDIVEQWKAHFEGFLKTVDMPFFQEQCQCFGGGECGLHWMGRGSHQSNRHCLPLQFKEVEVVYHLYLIALPHSQCLCLTVCP